MTIPRLKPCPFCGGTNLSKDMFDEAIHCDDCGACGPEGFTKEWNRRHREVKHGKD